MAPQKYKGVFTVHVHSSFAWKIAFRTILQNNVKVIRQIFGSQRDEDPEDKANQI